MLCIGLLDFPKSLIIEIISAVQIIALFIGIQMEGLSSQFKRRPCNPVGISADSRSKKGSPCLISRYVIISKHNVPPRSCPIRNNKTDKRRAIIRDLDLHSILIFHCVKCRLLSCGSLSKVFFLHICTITPSGVLS